MNLQAILLCVLVGTAPVLAQTRKPTLDKLLRQLHKVDAKQWQSRMKLLQADVNRLRKQAAKARADAAAALRRAKQIDSRINRLNGEVARLQQLRNLVTKPLLALPGKIKKRTTTRSASAKKTARKKVPTKVPGKVAAKKTMTAKAKRAKKPPTAKQPATKKRSTKKLAAKKAAQPTSWITFEDQVLPVFENRCTVCHDADERSGGLDLSSYSGVTRGGSSGRTLVPFDLQRSRLWQLVSHQEKPTMPPDSRRIPEPELKVVAAWIQAGAPENKSAAVRLHEVRLQRQAKRRKTTKVIRREVLRLPLPKPGALRPARETPVAITSMAMSPASDILAVPGLRQVVLMQPSTGRHLGAMPFEGQVAALAFTADGRRLVAAGGDAGRPGQVRVYDMRRYRREFDLSGFRDTVLAAAWAPDGKRLAVGGTDKRVTVFTAAGKRLYRINEHKDWVLATAVSPDGRYLASADRAGRILVTDLPTGRNVHDLHRHKGAAHALAFAPNGQTLASAGADGTLRLARMSDGRELRRRTVGPPLLVLQWPGTGKQLLAAGQDGRLRVFRANGSPLFTLPSCGEWIYSLASASRGRVLLGDYRGRVHDANLQRRRITGSFRKALPRAKPRQIKTTALR